MRSLSLRTKLLAGVILILLPVLGLLLWEVRASYARQREAALDQQVRTAETVAALVDTMFDDSIDLGRALANDPVVRTFDPARIDPHLQRLAPDYPQYVAIAVFDANGDNVGDSVPYAPGEPRRDIAQRGHFEQLTATGQPVVSSVFLPNGGKPLIAVHVPVLDEGRAIGSVGLIFDPAHLAPHLANVQLGPDDTIGLIDPQGRLAFDSRRRDLSWDERDLSQAPPVQAALAGETVRTDNFTLFGDARVLGMVRSPTHGWVVAVTSPAAAVFASVDETLRRDLIGFGGIALVSLGGAWIFSGRVNAMAKRLQATVESLAMARAEAETERARLLTVLESAPHGILFVEAGTDRVFANPRAIRLLGQSLSPEGGRAQVFGRICYPDGRPFPPEKLPSSRALGGKPVQEQEMLFVRPDGGRVPVLTSAAPVRSPEGTVIGAVVAFQDISTLKELERLREEWTSIIAHDLRQPVTVITGYAGLLAKQAEQQAPPLKTPAEHIRTSAHQLNRMIADLLDSSRIESRRLQLERRPVDLPALVQAVVERTAEVTRGHPVRVEIKGDIPRLVADPERLEQILGNLLSNAAKYGYPNTEIVVEVKCRDKDVQVSVTNQGKGIPPEELPMLFTRFHRTRLAVEEPVAGLGLGLYITKGLVEAHGGRIWAESIPGETTTFRFTLPVVTPAPVP